MNVKPIIGALWMAGMISAAGAAEPAAAPVTAACAACHGAQGEGNPALGAPRLAGQDASYLERQLQNFKNGMRAYHHDDKSGQQMKNALAVLNEADVKSVALWFSQIRLTGKPPAASHNVAAGQALYISTCSACHGLQGQGYPQLKAPNLAMLDSAYIKGQVAAFTLGWRGNAEQYDQPGIWMRSIATHISNPKQLNEVLAYLASLPATGNP